MKKQKIIWDDKKIQKVLNGRLFGHLSMIEKERVAFLFHTPGDEEFELYKRIVGKTPAQAMNIMAKEFVKRFPGMMNVKQVKNYLSPCRSWVDLDVKITLFVRTLRELHLYIERAQRPNCPPIPEPVGRAWEQHLDFWDKMRYLTHALPKPRDHQRPNSKSQIATIDITQSCDYVECKFCWRTVPYHSGHVRYNKKLCFEHDLMSSHPIIRKHRRLKKQVDELASSIVKQLEPLYPVSVNQRQEYRRINRIHMLNAETSPLKMLVPYLAEKSNYSWDEEDLLHAFHGPFPENLDKSYVKAMEKYIDNNANFEPLVLYPQLARAEAWLTLLKADKRRKDNRFP